MPLAVRGVETSPRRRTAITLLAAAGLVATLILFGALVVGPIDAAVQGHHIAYMVPIPGGAAISVLYVMATCGALLDGERSTAPGLRMSNLLAVVLLVWLTVGGLTSLWCVWAAITSVAIDLYLRDGERRTRVVDGHVSDATRPTPPRPFR